MGYDRSFRGKRKQDARDTDAGETSTLDRILRSLNDVKSEVGGFRKLLLDNGFMPEDPTPSTKQRQNAAAGKENGQEPKPRTQRQEECAAAATKAKNKDKTSKQAPPFVPVRQDVSTDSDSEAEKCAAIASVKKAPPRVDYRNDMQYGGWHKNQSANEDEVLFSALASMCLADEDLAGSQLCPGMPSSLPRDKVVVNLLSPYSSFLGFQAQHASSGHHKIII